ncbi:MAG TPA: TonB-dependent receptor [Steroidobacteraceae bacterium]|nr:TonB-dependent receptor [Steroidobacteraceae bacterium]
MLTSNSRRASWFLAAGSLVALAAGQARAQGVATRGVEGSAAADSQNAGNAAGRGGANGELQEIIVTAQKRREDIQTVPIAITAVSGEKLENLGIANTQDLARVVPGLTISSSLGGTQAHLRGIGSTATGVGAENSVATYIDGVYVLSLSGALVELNDIEQVEVLKGPQGTLFGRNATGGVISIRTRDPSHELGGNVNLSYGNYNTASTQFYLTGGITDTLAADVAGFVSYQGDGWGKNLFNGIDVNRLDEYAVRSKWLFAPTDRDQLRLIGDYSVAKGNRYNSGRTVFGTSANYGPGSTVAAQRPDLAPYVASGALAPFAVVGDPYVFNGGFYDIDVAVQPTYLFKNGGASLQWDHAFDGLQLTSITAYRRAYTSAANQFSSVPAFRSLGSILEKDSQFSQELRLGSAEGATRPWVVGLYYLHGRWFTPEVGITGTTIAPLESLNFLSNETTESGAAFGQVTTPVWPGGHLTGGLRYNTERRRISGETVVEFPPLFGIPNAVSGITDAHKTFSKPTWRIALDQQLAPGILGYLSYNRGFKSGLFNGIPASSVAVQPEILDAYEAGLKTELLDRRIRLNVAGFHYDYKNIQVTVYGPVSSFLANGAGARADGVDMDLAARVGSHLTISGGATVMDSKFTSYPDAPFLVPQPLAAGGGINGSAQSAKGKKLPYAPNSTFNLGGSYTARLGDGETNLNLNYSFSGKWYAGPDNIAAQPSYGLLDGSATYTLPGGRFTVGLWARNITGKKYYVNLTSLANPGGQEGGFVGAPRTYGVKFAYQ